MGVGGQGRGGGRGGGEGSALVRNVRPTWGWPGYLADRYVKLIFNYIRLVFGLSTELLVQLRRVTRRMRYE